MKDKLMIVRDEKAKGYDLPDFGIVTIRVSDGKVTMIETTKKEIMDIKN
ncbi:hypothetical protein ACYSNR_03210 [Enterococcus sp. LJL128]